MKNKPLVLDPMGYFLIQVRHAKIEVGFCKYQDMELGRSNKVLSALVSEEPREILSWIEENGWCSQPSHLRYLKRELSRAAEAIRNGKDYIQG
jgi:hypothetical protein